jgi:hypothetical protein
MRSVTVMSQWVERGFQLLPYVGDRCAGGRFLTTHLQASGIQLGLERQEKSKVVGLGGIGGY